MIIIKYRNTAYLVHVVINFDAIRRCEELLRDRVSQLVECVRGVGAERRSRLHTKHII